MKFEFDQNEAQVILDGLMELPFKKSNFVISKLMQQVQDNNKPATVAEQPADKPAE